MAAGGDWQAAPRDLDRQAVPAAACSKAASMYGYNDSYNTAQGAEWEASAGSEANSWGAARWPDPSHLHAEDSAQGGGGGSAVVWLPPQFEGRPAPQDEEVDALMHLMGV